MAKRRSLISEDERSEFAGAPSEADSGRLTTLGKELHGVDADIVELEEQLAKRKKRRQEIQMKELPDLMREIGVDRIGLPSSDMDLVLEPFYHANIAAEWEEDKRQRAFAYLEKRGDGDLIQTSLTFAFRRDQRSDVEWLLTTIELVRKLRAEAGLDEECDIPEPTVRQQVPWNTLTAWLREQTEAGNPVDLDILGATVGMIAKFKARKKGRQ